MEKLFKIIETLIGLLCQLKLASYSMVGQLVAFIMLVFSLVFEMDADSHIEFLTVTLSYFGKTTNDLLFLVGDNATVNL